MMFGKTQKNKIIVLTILIWISTQCQQIVHQLNIKQNTTQILLVS